ncbi:MAG: GNAT family N-acetyltransferase [Rhodothermales bacterium]
MPIRAATAADVPDLAALYAAAVRIVGPAHYDAAQVEAWAAFAEEPRFRSFVLDPHTVVAEDASGITGFAGLADDGHVTALYVRPDRMRQGIGSALLCAVVERAGARGIARLYTEASAFSRPVFARHAFRLDAVEVVERRGATFERYRMVCDLGAGAESPRRM